MPSAKAPRPPSVSTTEPSCSAETPHIPRIYRAALPNLAVLDQGGAARGAAGPASAPGSALAARPAHAGPHTGTAPRSRRLTRHAAVRLRVTLRTVIIEVRQPTRPSHSQELSFPALSPSAGEAARRACDTQRGPPPACAALEATESAAGPRSNPGTDDRRNRGRLARTGPCSRLRNGRPRCGSAGAARTPSCRGRADRQAGACCRRWGLGAATGRGDHAGAVRRRRPGGKPVRYRSRCQGRQDCSLKSPPALPRSGAGSQLPPDGNTRALSRTYPAESDMP